MTRDEFIAAKISLGLPWTRLAALLGRSESQLIRWAAGYTPIPHWVPNELARIRDEAGKLKAAKKSAA